MKKNILFIVMLIFTLNTASLSALASCPYQNKIQTEKTQADLPDCHKKSPDAPKKTSHCKGVCFCLHAQMNQTLLSPQPVEIVKTLDKQAVMIAPQEIYPTRAITPPLRPPISHS